MYVDGTTKLIDPSQFKKPDSPHPVQVLFEFQTKGVANANATGFVSTKVMELIKDSGLFSQVAQAPVDGGALLSVTINNVPITDDAFAKGFATGFTFGLVGSTVTDGYVCTARYSSGTVSTPIVKQARHSIHTTLGSAGAPANATRAADPKEAVYTMTGGIISNVLNDLSQDPNFK